MAKTPIDKLSATVQKILDEYGDSIGDNMTEAVKAVTKAGVTALKSESKATFNGSKYYKSWTSQTEEKRVGTTSIIYSKMPGLPHLLEHGHAKRGGGRVPGREHIAKVEAQIIEQFEQEVEKL